MLEPRSKRTLRRARCASRRLCEGHIDCDTVDNVEDLGAVPHELIDAGDRVIVPVRMHGRLRDSGEPVAYELVQVWLGRNGKAIRLVTYPDREAAIADATVASAI